ncbi:hypothetical protein XJ32_05090 [Helicobacter bilis]|uniref:Uncharacterized protein n=1 Tax=Helicobacter bilis TaxID=37372 RepID=A0A1Q2LGL4_9HELI|nr:hypothetical protein XJ32_05090 [Helicobacter bilis]
MGKKAQAGLKSTQSIVCINSPTLYMLQKQRAVKQNKKQKSLDISKCSLLVLKSGKKVRFYSLK